MSATYACCTHREISEHGPTAGESKREATGTGLAGEFGGVIYEIDIFLGQEAVLLFL